MLLWEMEVGTAGICTSKYNLFVHKDIFDPPWLNPNSYIMVSELDKKYCHDSAVYPQDAFVERIDRGWLVDGVLYETICQETCHPFHKSNNSSVMSYEDPYMCGF